MHVAVIGAGAFGGWTALHLLQAGVQVTVIEAWGAGNSRSSSGGETRIIRASYADDRTSMRFALRSFELWNDYQARWQTRLMEQTGMVFLAAADDEFVAASHRELTGAGVNVELWSAAEAQRQYPQMSFSGIDQVLFEPGAGMLTARENCRAVLQHVVEAGVRFERAWVAVPELSGDLDGLAVSNGATVRADAYVFACGPWLGQVFPDLLGHLIRPTRQDVLFVATPPGDGRFSAGTLPCWADGTSEHKFYGIPDVQHRGFKLASDVRGPDFDPSRTDRLIDPQSWIRAREYIEYRFPALAVAALVESRVCQYENTPDLGLVIDFHPAAKNVLLVGGGSGHGYKQGPAVGEYVAGLLQGKKRPEPAFLLSRFGNGVRGRQSSF